MGTPLWFEDLEATVEPRDVDVSAERTLSAEDTLLARNPEPNAIPFAIEAPSWFDDLEATIEPHGGDASADDAGSGPLASDVDRSTAAQRAADLLVASNILPSDDESDSAMAPPESEDWKTSIERLWVQPSPWDRRFSAQEFTAGDEDSDGAADDESDGGTGDESDGDESDGAADESAHGAVEDEGATDAVGSWLDDENLESGGTSPSADVPFLGSWLDDDDNELEGIGEGHAGPGSSLDDDNVEVGDGSDDSAGALAAQAAELWLEEVTSVTPSRITLPQQRLYTPADFPLSTALFVDHPSIADIDMDG